MNEVDLGAWALGQIVIASLVITAAAMLVLRRFTNGDAYHRARSLAQAHLLEIRLFPDEPRLVLRAWRDLIADQFRILRILAPSVLFLTLVGVPAFWVLEALYGRAPLNIGESAVVTVPDHEHGLTVPDTIAVESRPVYVSATGQTSWRIRASTTTVGTITTASSEARIVAGQGPAFLPKPLGSRRVVEITYPPAVVVGLPWLAWFVLFSIVFAIVLRRPLRAPL